MHPNGLSPGAGRAGTDAALRRRCGSTFAPTHPDHRRGRVSAPRRGAVGSPRAGAFACASNTEPPSSGSVARRAPGGACIPATLADRRALLPCAVASAHFRAAGAARAARAHEGPYGKAGQWGPVRLRPHPSGPHPPLPPVRTRIPPVRVSRRPVSHRRHPGGRAQYARRDPSPLSGGVTPDGALTLASTRASTTASTSGSQGAAEPGSGARSHRTWPVPVSEGGSTR